MTRPKVVLLVLFVLVLSACTGSLTGDEALAAGEADVEDAALADTGSPPPDAGVSPADAGAEDSELDAEDEGSGDAGDSGDADAEGSTDAGPADSGVDTAIEDPTKFSAFPLADPDTVRARDGRYITYGTTVGAGQGPRCGGTGKLYVPYLVHGAGSSVGMSDCAAGDAMPGGPGSWAEPGGAIWAPGVIRFNNRYIMFYTATKKGTGQKCIGRAISDSARGPFAGGGEWACPPQGRWAIDANPFVNGDNLLVTYRDDAINSFPETGISVVRTDDLGRAEWSTRRDLLKSSDIDWDTIRINGTTHVIENPSMFRSNGVWYLAFSGNNWDSARYATGIARCGSSPRPATRCTPLRRGVERPYFGFTGDAGLEPYRGLPANRRGPGGMDIFRAADRSLRAVWHWWRPSDRSRHVVVGRLLQDAGGFYVGE